MSTKHLPKELVKSDLGVGEMEKLTKRFGGSVSLSRVIRRSQQSVYEGVARGILPWSWHNLMWAHAATHGITFTPPGMEGWSLVKTEDLKLVSASREAFDAEVDRRVLAAAGKLVKGMI